MISEVGTNLTPPAPSMQDNADLNDTALILADASDVLNVYRVTTETGIGGKSKRNWEYANTVTGELQTLRGSSAQLQGGLDSNYEYVFFILPTSAIKENDKLTRGEDHIGYVDAIIKYSDHYECYLTSDQG